MSKIHDALKQLKEDGQPPESRTHGSNDPNRKHTDGQYDASLADDRRGSILRRRRYALPEGGEPERPPKTSIEVSYEELRAGGSGQQTI